ncbi:hypothetical protein LIER_03297 [Lithospermum erythrorhizon]|uniref:Uncharacterized protein n=1 Tax=Lithospermum erythrorhizon TaxID=34254 RepID=A0AAV3NSM4_LITER
MGTVNIIEAAGMAVAGVTIPKGPGSRGRLKGKDNKESETRSRAKREGGHKFKNEGLPVSTTEKARGRLGE